MLFWWSKMTGNLNRSSSSTWQTRNVILVQRWHTFPGETDEVVNADLLPDARRERGIWRQCAVLTISLLNYFNICLYFVNLFLSLFIYLKMKLLGAQFSALSQGKNRFQMTFCYCVAADVKWILLFFQNYKFTEHGLNADCNTQRSSISTWLYSLNCIQNIPVCYKCLILSAWDVDVSERQVSFLLFISKRLKRKRGKYRHYYFRSNE